ncbi:MAG: hypothetical protein JWP45_3026 [Mucilaginibacter sp.]|nr:hypothetical protein [Mucilaginibacter sp.]MDB5140808.1 hypothetical protein [Mucilaginibacter sp.]
MRHLIETSIGIIFKFRIYKSDNKSVVLFKITFGKQKFKSSFPFLQKINLYDISKSLCCTKCRKTSCSI